MLPEGEKGSVIEVEGRMEIVREKVTPTSRANHNITKNRDLCMCVCVCLCVWLKLKPDHCKPKTTDGHLLWFVPDSSFLFLFFLNFPFPSALLDIVIRSESQWKQKPSGLEVRRARTSPHVQSR